MNNNIFHSFHIFLLVCLCGLVVNHNDQPLSFLFNTSFTFALGYLVTPLSIQTLNGFFPDMLKVTITLKFYEFPMRKVISYSYSIPWFTRV